MTIQDLYTQYLDGKVTKQKFLYEARRDQNLTMISPTNSFDDVVKILKNKSIISEKASKESKQPTGKQDVEIIAKTIDMVNPYEYANGMNYELGIIDIPAPDGDLDEGNVLRAQKKVLANLTKNPSYYTEKLYGRVKFDGDETVEINKGSMDAIGKGKKNIIREGGNLGHNELSSIHPEGAYWVVTYRGPKGTTEKSFKSEEEARKFQDGLDEGYEDNQMTNWSKVVQALSQFGSKDEIKQYLTSLHQSGDTFETVEDYVEDFRNYVADKGLDEHGQYAGKVADVNPRTQGKIKEISSDTFKRAVDVARGRGEDRRASNLGSTFLNSFVGKPLMGGKISKIDIQKPSFGDYFDVTLEVLVPTQGTDGMYDKPTYLYYDVENDDWGMKGKGLEVTRLDARMLSQIATKINPDTKYSKGVENFDIKGFNEGSLKESYNPFPMTEDQEAVIRKYAEATGIAFENLLNMVAEAKAKKKAKKDYDGDGEIESSEEEYKGSRDKAIKQATNEDLDLGHQDNEPHMIKGELYQIAKQATELYKMIDAVDNMGEVDFPHWWQAKIVLAKNYLQGSKDYLESALAVGNEEGEIEETTYAGKDAEDDLKRDRKFPTLSGPGKIDAINTVKQGGVVKIG